MMHRYFFHVFNDEKTRDDEGQEFCDLSQAKAAAERSCRALAAHSIMEHGHLVLDHRIEIEGSGGEPLASVRFGDVVRIV